MLLLTTLFSHAFHYTFFGWIQDIRSLDRVQQWTSAIFQPLWRIFKAEFLVQPNTGMGISGGISGVKTFRQALLGYLKSCQNTRGTV